MTYTVTSWINDGEPVTVRARYSPGTPDVMYLPSGGPGYEGDPAELEIVSILDAGGNEVLDEDAYEELADRIAEDVADEYRTEVEEAQVSRYLSTKEYE